MSLRSFFILPLLMGGLQAQENLEQKLSQLRQNPFHVPTAESVVALGAKDQAKDVMESALREYVAKPQQDPTVNLASMAAFALLAAVDRENEPALAYLRSRAQEAIGLAAPLPFAPGVTVPLVPGATEPASFSPEFLDWVRARGNREPIAEVYRINQYGQDLMLLGMAGDRESIPVFRKALKSNQFSIAMGAVQAAAALNATELFDEALEAAGAMARDDGARRLFGTILLTLAGQSAALQGKVRSFVNNPDLFLEIQKRRQLEPANR